MLPGAVCSGLTHQLADGRDAGVHEILRPAGRVCERGAARIDTEMLVERGDDILIVHRARGGLRGVFVGGTDDLAGLLKDIGRGSSLVVASKKSGISYRGAWGKLNQVEACLGMPLIARTKGHGSVLTEFGHFFIQFVEQIQAAHQQSGDLYQDALLKEIKKIQKLIGKITNKKPKIKNLSNEPKKISGFSESTIVPNDLKLLLNIQENTLPRTKLTKKVYDYIEANNLKCPINKRILRVNDKLAKALNLTNEQINKINNSKLPSAIKQAMIDHPIEQMPSISLNETLDMDFVKGAKRLMEQEGVSNKKQPAQKQTQNYSSNIDMSAIATLVENTVRKVMDEKLNQILTAQQTQTINENLVLKVGDSVFKGKITGVGKSK